MKNTETMYPPGDVCWWETFERNAQRDLLAALQVDDLAAMTRARRVYEVASLAHYASSKEGDHVVH